MSSDGVSVSSISPTPATTGCHMLKIDGYSQMDRFVNGSGIMSSTFKAAGQTWSIRYFPKGSHYSCADHISLFINLHRASSIIINAKIRFSLVPPHGKPAPETPYCRSFIGDFRPTTVFPDSGIERFIKREDLEKSEYLLDDCFAVRCDIDVLTMTTAADPVVKTQDLERLGWPCSCEDDLCKRFHPGRTVEPVSPSIGSPEVKTESAPTTPAPAQRRRGVTAAWFRHFGCGKI